MHQKTILNIILTQCQDTVRKHENQTLQTLWSFKSSFSREYQRPDTYSLRSQKSYFYLYQSYETVETADKCKRRKRIIHQKMCTDVCLSECAATTFDNTKSKLCSSQSAYQFQDLNLILKVRWKLTAAHITLL